MIYLISGGKSMTERQMTRAAEIQAGYIEQVASAAHVHGRPDRQRQETARLRHLE